MVRVNSSFDGVCGQIPHFIGVILQEMKKAPADGRRFLDLISISSLAD
jgi:hypothetical protein